MAAARDTIPIILSASATTSLVATDATHSIPGPAGQLPSAGLMNTLSDPIEVTDLLFSTIAKCSSAIPPLGWAGWLVDVDLRLGRRAITNGFCPMFAIPPYHGALPETVSSGGTLAYYLRSERWRLPRPMILMPGESIAGFVRLSDRASFNYDSLLTPNASATVQATVTARGRRLRRSDLGKTRFVPYASGTTYPITATDGLSLPPVIAPPAGNAPAQTYRNTLDRPLFVTSLNLRLPASHPIFQPDYGAAGVFVRIVGPAGLVPGPRGVIVDRQLFAAVSGVRHAIEVNHVLAPGQDYNVTIEGQEGQATGPAGGVPDGCGPVLGAIVGYREEAMS